MARLYPKIAKKAMLVLSAALVAFFVVEPVLAAIPNDPNYKDQEQIWNQINAPTAWDYTTGSKRVVVAIIDTGLDTWHEDIRDNLWTNFFEIPDNNVDDDRNGYIDDVNGWNFVEDNNDVRPSVFNNEDDKEAVRHGTIAAGLVGAKGNNKLDGTGLNWNVSLMTLRAIKSSGSGSTGAVAKAIDYAVDNGADVISMSFMGELRDSTLYDSLRRAYDKGVVIVSAAGNFDTTAGNGNLNQKPLYPGCYSKEGNGVPWILTVGSVDENDKLSEFSEYGDCINIMAPGEYIYSTERYAPQYGYPNQFGGPWFGTSFATPLVAGTAALIKSIHPEWGAKEIIPLILSTADPIDALNPGKEGQLGRGRINVGRAVTSAMATPIKKTKGAIFYTPNGTLGKYDLYTQKATTIGDLPPGTLVTSRVDTIYSDDYFAAVMKQDQVYRLGVFKTNGDLVFESEIPRSVIGEKTAVRFVSGKYFIVGSKFNKKTNKTTFIRFDVFDNKLSSKVIGGQSSAWNIGNSGNIYSIALNKGTVALQTVNFGGAEQITRNIGGVSKIFAVEQAGQGVQILAIQNGKVKLLFVSPNGLISKTISSSVQKNWRLRLFAWGNRSAFMPYTKEGGAFVVYDQDLNPVFTQKMAALP